MNDKNCKQSLEHEQIKSALESLIFISDKPMLLDDLKQIFTGVDASGLRGLLEELKKEYEEKLSGIRLMEIAGGFQMVTARENAGLIKQFYKLKHTEKLTGPSLETLAIIAYKQPVTRVDIETIRGVNVDGVVRSLLEKNLIRIVGRKEVIGRPFVYGTSRIFLDYFGLRSLDELPKIEEFARKEAILDMKLASGEAAITPLTQEEQEELTQAEPPQDEGEHNENQ
ncbi:MAG: SMC-Scp complex subunit ScpB [Candidatus Omnitrophota bacterium]